MVSLAFRFDDPSVGDEYIRETEDRLNKAGTNILLSFIGMKFIKINGVWFFRIANNIPLIEYIFLIALIIGLLFNFTNIFFYLIMSVLWLFAHSIHTQCLYKIIIRLGSRKKKIKPLFLDYDLLINEVTGWDR